MKISKRVIQRLRINAPLFAALGDETRLTLLTRLSSGSLLSITQLSIDTELTRQAITKHLHVLEEAGLVRSIRRGRETLFQLEPKPLKVATDALANISAQWDEALDRLKNFVEQ